MSHRVRTVVIAGGGTGGHLIPGLAVARELVARGVERVVFIGTARGIETTLVPQAGFELKLIDVRGLKNVGFRATVESLVALPRSIWQSRRLLADLRPDVVFGIGGYASGPVLFAAALRHISSVVLEVNARTGLANRIASRWVNGAAVNFPESAADFRRAIVTGVPVRAAFFAPAAATGSDSGFGPGDARPRVLVFGGSRGARAINECVVQVARIWRESNWGVHLIHQTGAAQYNQVLESYRRAGIAPRALTDSDSTGSGAYVDVAAAPFIDTMAPVIQAADLIVCRSGASTLGELAAAGKAALLIPFPEAADNHQVRNARSFERAGAAAVMEQREITPDALARRIKELIGTPEMLQRMGDAARTLAKPRAAEAIADLVLNAAG